MRKQITKLKYSCCVIVLLFSFSPLLAKDFKPQSMEVFLSEDSKAESAVWEKSCAFFANKLIVRKGPWAFGFFSDFKCLPLKQAPSKTANWVVKISSVSKQSTFEVSQRVLGDVLKPFATVTIPFHEQNIEWLQNESFSDALSANLMDQMPALLSVGRFQNELMVPQNTTLTINELVWGVLDFDEKNFKFFPNINGSVKVETSGGFLKFSLAGSVPKKLDQNIWIFNQRGPSARQKEFSAKLNEIHQALIQDSPIIPKTPDGEDPWARTLLLRGGISLYKNPAMLKQSKTIELLSDQRSGMLKGLNLNFRYIPSTQAVDENGKSISFFLNSLQIGYKVQWLIQHGILHSVAIVPRIGFWSVTANYSADFSSSVEEFSAKQELSLGALAVAELELSEKVRGQVLLGKELAGSILGTKTKTNIGSTLYGANLNWLVGSPFVVGKTRFSTFVHGFGYLEALRISTSSDSSKETFVTNIGYSGLGFGLIF